jgi:hypothetical protein
MSPASAGPGFGVPGGVWQFCRPYLPPQARFDGVVYTDGKMPLGSPHPDFDFRPRFYLTVKPTMFDSPPPGVGFLTRIFAVPDEEIWLAGT